MAVIVSLFRRKRTSNERRSEDMDLEDVVDAINDHLNTATVLISPAVVKCWPLVPEKQKQELLLHLNNFIMHIRPLYKKEIFAICEKGGRDE